MLTQSTLQIFRLHEYLRATRLNINSRFGGVFFEEPKRNICEKWGEILRRKKEEGRRRVKANYNYVLSLSSAELGRNLHLARITERGNGVMEENGC